MLTDITIIVLLIWDVRWEWWVPRGIRMSSHSVMPSIVHFIRSVLRVLSWDVPRLWVLPYVVGYIVVMDSGNVWVPLDVLSLLCMHVQNAQHDYIVYK